MTQSTADMDTRAAERLVHRLAGLAEREDRAALAALRRGLGKRPGEAPEALPYLVPYTEGLDPGREEDFHLVATLFALHPMPWPGVADPRLRNLGASLAKLRRRPEGDATSPDQGAEGGTKPGQDPVERRFIALLGANREDLPQHLRRAIALLKAKEVPVDWLTLLRDLRWWDADNRRVQREWAGSYWRPTDAQEAAEETDPKDE